MPRVGLDNRWLHAVCGRKPFRNLQASFRRIRRQKAFTLIEFMIVVAVIEILAAMAFPMYSEYVKKIKWTENINIADALSKQAMICVQVYGGSCTGSWGYITPQDMGLTVWPQGKYIKSYAYVFFMQNTQGFHVVIDGTPEVGGYHYDRGYTNPNGGNASYINTQSFKDSVPASIMRTWPLDPY